MQKKNVLDYFSGGMAMPNRNVVGDYRYNYQGQELDQETGKVAFELRLYDPRINRWLSPDPMGQYHSPYIGMGNDWANGIDPDGGYKNKWQAFWGWVGGGFKGSIQESDNPGTPWHKYSVVDRNDPEGIRINFGLNSSKMASVGYLSNGTSYYFQASVRQFKPNFSGRINESGIAGVFAYDFANGFYTTSQMFLGRSVGDYSMRNLDGTATTTDQGTMGFVGTATFGYGKYASSLKYLKPVKSSPKLWNIYQSSTKGIFNSRTSATNAYKIQIKSLNNMMSNHNGLVKILRQSNNATGYTQNTSSIIDYYINKD
ncbi:MAG: hypothetical protein L3J08_08035 [Flavobacteriaceae bacterium]|nr:hypothetical protein [Flavobacteriaceae bacterium]